MTNAKLASKSHSDRHPPTQLGKYNPKEYTQAIAPAWVDIRNYYL